MKDKISAADKKQILEGARVALGNPDQSQFWKDVEHRMTVREDARKGLVQPRPARK